MKRKPSLIPGLDRILSAREASVLLAIPEDELLYFYRGQREISLRNLLKRICRSNPTYHFPIIGETTYTLKGVMNSTGKGRSWSLFFLERNRIHHWCVGVHYLYSKAEVDNAWRKESFMWEEWIPLIQVSCVYGVDLRTVLQQIARGRIRVRPGNREQLVSRKDVMSLWKSKGEDGFRRYAQNTASTYLKHIKRLRKIAFADHLIDFDPSEEIEGIKWDHSCKRESLTEEEIEALKNAPFRDLEVKRAV